MRTDWEKGITNEYFSRNSLTFSWFSSTESFPDFARFPSWVTPCRITHRWSNFWHIYIDYGVSKFPLPLYFFKKNITSYYFCDEYSEKVLERAQKITKTIQQWTTSLQIRKIWHENIFVKLIVSPNMTTMKLVSCHAGPIVVMYRS